MNIRRPWMMQPVQRRPRCAAQMELLDQRSVPAARQTVGDHGRPLRRMFHPSAGQRFQPHDVAPLAEGRLDIFGQRGSFSSSRPDSTIRPNGVTARNPATALTRPS